MGGFGIPSPLPFDPANFKEQARWRTVGFEYVSQYRQFRFEHFPGFGDLNSKNVTDIFDDTHRTILIIGKGKPDSTLTAELLWQNIDWGGRWQWYAWATNLDNAVEELEIMTPTADRLQTLSYLHSCQRGLCDLGELEKKLE
ncbi:MAG: hypothetical protein ABIJ03_00560 [Patescibacteria group bacterium]|nr:hypothetical protein [Patescibacteria group bacterium]